MTPPRVFTDFHNTDPLGRLRLNCTGTIEDLARQQVQLATGLGLLLYSDDLDVNGRPMELQVQGTVEYSEAEHGWVARIDWNAIQRVPASLANGTLPAVPELPVSVHP